MTRPRPAVTILATLLACAVAATSSCVVGPNYKRPAVGVPTTFKSATTQETTAAALAPDWWRLFGDPALDELEQTAMAANTDVRAASARVLQARAAARVTGSAFYPVITFEPSIERTRSPKNGVFVGSSGTSTVLPGGTGTGGTGTGGTGTGSGTGTSTGGSRVTGGGSPGRTTTTVRIPFDLSYEVDIWGRVRRSVEASQARADASAADFHVVLQTLQADVAQAYFSLRFLDLQEKILSDTVESYRREVQLTQKAVRAGVVAQIAFLQADALLYSTLAQLADVRRQRADQEHALATLLGQTPADLSLGAKPLDVEPPSIPAGLPADLLRRRPDVAEAERNLVAANADVGVATADFYPRLTLTGSAGFESFDVQHAVDWQQRVFSFGPGVTLPIFEGGRLRANLEQVKARYDEVVAQYRGTVLVAVRDVEDSLTDLHLRADQARAQDQAVRSSREYLRLSELQYRQGLTSYLQVTDAERTLLSNELTAAQILNQRLASTVLLIKSLGGGWDGGDTTATGEPVAGK